MNQSRPLIYIFSRDFSQWLNELIRTEYVHDFPRIWGRGLEDQIIHYNGRAFTRYHYESDHSALADFIIHKPLVDRIFSKEVHDQFKVDVQNLQMFIANVPRNTTGKLNHFNNLVSLFKIMYPWYALSIFLAGSWRENFLDFHGKNAKKILDRVFKSRVQSEGLIKLIDLYVREWLCPLIVQHGYSPSDIKLLSFIELQKFIEYHELPPKIEINERSKGFVFKDNIITSTDDFPSFLSQNELLILDRSFKSKTSVRGSVACPSQLSIKGKVQLIFNSEEIKKFVPGSILVTPMTSVEYLPAMKQAVAIITDEGGLTCHASIVARELGVPCIIGTKNATEIFKDGDMVEVDATRGVVKKIL